LAAAEASSGRPTKSGGEAVIRIQPGQEGGRRPGVVAGRGHGLDSDPVGLPLLRLVEIGLARRPGDIRVGLRPLRPQPGVVGDDMAISCASTAATSASLRASASRPRVTRIRPRAAPRRSPVRIDQVDRDPHGAAVSAFGDPLADAGDAVAQRRRLVGAAELLLHILDALRQDGVRRRQPRRQGQQRRGQQKSRRVDAMSVHLSDLFHPPDRDPRPARQSSQPRTRMRRPCSASSCGPAPSRRTASGSIITVKSCR